MKNPTCSCVFIKKWKTKFASIIIYIDDLNHNETFIEFIRTITYFKRNLRLNILEKQNLILTFKSSILQIEFDACIALFIWIKHIL